MLPYHALHQATDRTNPSAHPRMGAKSTRPTTKSHHSARVGNGGNHAVVTNGGNHGILSSQAYIKRHHFKIVYTLLLGVK